MKQPKTIAKKAIIGTIASGVLVSSCTQGYNFDNSLYGTFAEDTQTANILVSLNESNLSEEFIHQAKSISTIIDRIINNKKERRKFAEDPTAFFASNELSFSITLSTQEKNFLLALTDDSVIESIKNNNIDLFLKTCKEKGYFTTLSDEAAKPGEIRKLFNTDEDYDQFMSSLGNEVIVEAVAGVCVAVVAGAVFYLGAAVITAAVAGVLAGTGMAAVHYAGVKVSVRGFYEYENAFVIQDTVNAKEPVLKIWSDNNGTIANTVLYDEFIEKQTINVISGIEKEYSLPEAEKERIAHFIKVQLEGHYGLRK